MNASRKSSADVQDWWKRFNEDIWSYSCKGIIQKSYVFS
jgi:hypothetical protein